jgi:hypothetical protein
MAKYNDVSLRDQMVISLIQDCHANIQMAECNVYAFLENPVGVGDHANIMETIQGQLDIISQNQDRLTVLDKFHEF